MLAIIILPGCSIYWLCVLIALVRIRIIVEMLSTNRESSVLKRAAVNCYDLSQILTLDILAASTGTIHIKSPSIPAKFNFEKQLKETESSDSLAIRTKKRTLSPLSICFRHKIFNWLFIFAENRSEELNDD